MYTEYIEEQLDDLKGMMENNTFDVDRCNNFIRDMDLEDDCSHNEIRGIQQQFEKGAREYLSENHPGEYAMWCDWCVHISTVDVYRDIMWRDGKYSDRYKQLRESRDII